MRNQKDFTGKKFAPRVWGWAEMGVETFTIEMAFAPRVWGWAEDLVLTVSVEAVCPTRVGMGRETLHHDRAG